MRLAKLNPGFVTAGATPFNVSKAIHDGKSIKLPLNGSHITNLPGAVGSGAKYRFIVQGLGSAPVIVKCGVSTDKFVGAISGWAGTGNAMLAFAPGANDDTITLNHTTAGGVNAGEYFEVEDIGVGTYAVRGLLSTNGAAFTTPFSNTP